MEVIPAIIAKDFAELKEKVKQVESYAKWVQLDIMDGDFVPNTTWNKAQDLEGADFSVFLEAHLMISNPGNHINKWLGAGIKRIIVHIEAIGNEPQHTIKELVERCHKKGAEFGIALSPETPASVVDSFGEILDLVLVLGVNPGFGGQEFRKEVLPKISELKKKYPLLKIGVDGGVNAEIGKECAEAGADILVAGSYIFKSGDIKGAIEKLENEH